MESELTTLDIASLFRFIIFIIATLAVLFLKTRKDPLIFKRLAEFNGPLSLPVLGTAYLIPAMGGPVGIFNTICHKFIHDYGRLFRVWQFHYPQVVIASAKDAEKVLHAMQHNAKSRNYTLLHPWLGLGLITLKDNMWRAHRKILTPAFHFNILHEFLHIFNKNARILSDKLQMISAEGKEFNVFSLVSLCALDIINESSMGAIINAQLHEDSPYVKAADRLHVYNAQRYFSLLLHVPLFYQFSTLKKKIDAELKIINDFTDQVIAKRRQYLQSSKMSEKLASEDEFGQKQKSIAFIDTILLAEENGEYIMSDKDIRDEVNTFMFAGHDTVTCAMSWALFMIGNNPGVQEKVVEELIQVFGDSGREPSARDLTELKYLERCIKETIRLYPSVPFIEREIRQDITLDCGKVIPAGCTASFVFYALHRDPEHFPDPEKFDPDRFLPENCQGRHPYAYLPFSAGPRNCIGQKYALLEAKAVLSTILRRFGVKVAFKPEDAILEIGMVLQPVNGLQVQMFERDDLPNLRILH